MIRIFSPAAWRLFGSMLLTATYNTAATKQMKIL